MTGMSRHTWMSRHRWPLSRVVPGVTSWHNINSTSFYFSSSILHSNKVQSPFNASSEPGNMHKTHKQAEKTFGNKNINNIIKLEHKTHKNYIK